MLGEGEGELARCSGEVMLLAGGLGVVSAMLESSSENGRSSSVKDSNTEVF